MTRNSEEKYTSELRYRMVKARRWIIRRLIRDLVGWEPLENPANGYTIVLGCNVPLARMISCNLKFLSRQDLSSVDRIIVVLDRPRDQMADDVEPAVRSRYPSLPLDFLYYGERQRQVCDLIGWPWVQSWLSWSMGIRQVRTKYALLHDFDAMLLRSDIMEERYRSIRKRGHQYVGVRFYEGNGVIPDDRLVTTFELMFDAQYVRKAFEPIDLFNHVTRHKGRRVDFDTFLHAQSLSGAASTLPIPEEDLVHPSQLICQFEDFRLGRRAIPPSNNLMLVPYFLYAGDEPQLLRRLTLDLEEKRGHAVELFGKSLRIAELHPGQLEWIAKQAFRLERAAVGEVRGEVQRYFTAVDEFIARANGGAPVLEASPGAGLGSHSDKDATSPPIDARWSGDVQP